MAEWRVPGYSAAMLRITELKLPLNHPEEALAAAIRNRLRITPRDLVRYAHLPAARMTRATRWTSNSSIRST